MFVYMAIPEAKRLFISWNNMNKGEIKRE